MTTLNIGSADTTRPAWLSIARSTGVLAVSLLLTTGVLAGMSVVVDTWSK